jgi:16S rRNA (cytosine967-C5)-methyltransferase
LATDVHPEKTKRLNTLLGDNFCAVRVHDATAAVTEAAFHRVLLDAPCTGLGVIRRHPEIRWRRDLADIADRAHLQTLLLHNAAHAVLPGGILVYSVCSDAPEEGPDLVAPFLAQHPEFTLDTPESETIAWPDLMDEGCLRLWPHVHGADGFFAVRFRRRGAP